MNEVRNNPLRTRQDMIRAAIQLIDPAAQCLTPGKARLHIADSTAYYTADIAGMEGFSRVMWAIVPMLAGKCPEVEPYWQMWREGVIAGTDPKHHEYWGDISGCDQRMVEMAVMGMALMMIPKRFYGELTAKQQENLIRWLDQINRHDMPKNNWRFFRVLVNEGFRAIGRPVDEARMEEDLTLLESHYTQDGWYFDKATQRDYYTLWAFHFYGLVYAAYVHHDSERCARFRERARLIAPRFACWFDREGRALPYGRSMTYRFAQSCFFSAMALAGQTAPGLGWGEMKGLLLGNLRFWLSMPIFDRGGCLTVGYGYPNLCLSEGYNSPGSPYWAMKAFAVLALPEDHPFWQAEEDPFAAPERFCDEPVRLLTVREKEGRFVTAYTAGNHAYEHMHEDEKYEKFAYSTQFAFSVVKEAGTLGKGAFDSMLALRRAGRGLWHGRSGCSAFALTEEKVTFTWSPMEGVEINSEIIPVDGAWHVRRHVIRADAVFDAAEGGFAVRRDWEGARPCENGWVTRRVEENMALARGDFGSCAIYALRGYTRAEVLWPENNTNLMYPRTVIPTLHAAIAPGETVLVCAVWCSAGNEEPDHIPQEVLHYAQ